jgi:uncharacterized protein (TIGR00375 family)
MVEVIADLQVHSKHSRATSKDLSLENLEKWGEIKGLSLIGTGDFQHPIHRKEIDEYLEEDDKGILWSKKRKVGFLWQTEISLMYSENGKRRAVHLLVFVPNKNIAEDFIKYLESKGRIDYDGRPIFGITARDFVKDVKSIDEKIEIIPAHVMTPWFGIFGSKSGFDSLEEGFGDQRDKIFAIESGISADPSMLWRFQEKVNVVSFSDAHSFWPWRLGREATIFEFDELSYENIIQAIRTGKGIKATIETPPEYGRYHWDGHRNCDFSCSPEETRKLKGKCPKCGGKLTIGVENRCEELSKEPKGWVPENKIPFYRILPLHELIAIFSGVGISSKSNWKIYNELIEKFGNELNILLKVSKKELIEKEVNEKLIDLILRNREDKIKIIPGYDGVYGKAEIEKQKTLF